jgi:Flp pilus assembly protein TadB
VTKKSRLSRTDVGEGATVDRDLRFALLVTMMIPDERRRRRSGRGRTESCTSSEELAMTNDRMPNEVMPTETDSSERPVVTEANKDRVRAGVTGHNVRYVVIFSCAIVIVAFIIIYAVVWR